MKAIALLLSLLLLPAVLTTASVPAAAQSVAPVTTRDLTRQPLVSAEPLPSRPEHLRRPALPDEAPPPPFGAALFEQPMLAAGEGPNPDYRVAIGDQLAVQVWGSVETEATTVVDPQGNIFLPEIGPVPVAGVRSGDLSEHVEAHVRAVFRENVGVYATLISWRAIGVYVTGYVERPGRYPGAPRESVLDFLGKAGGIDLERGSFRDLRVLRDGQVLARIDLYDFLLDGRLPKLEFREGDTILVGEQGDTVAVGGQVRNDYRFEVPPARPLTGGELLRLARPLPQATHVRLEGSRDGAPMSQYLSLEAFAGEALRDQDRVTFDADAPRRMLTVEVSGANLGPSVFVTDPDVTLIQLLDHIEVDPQLADTSAVHLRRQSVAQQQKESLEAALDRLERALFTATVATEGEAQIRRAEAEMVSRYIERARLVEPDGTVVVVGRSGEMVDLRLEDGDEVVVPQARNVVVVGGEVIAPQAVAYEPGQTAADFIGRAGGYTDRGDRSQIILRHLNGQVSIVSPSTRVQPGDEVIVAPRIEFKTFQFAKDLVQVLYQIAVTSRILLTL